MGSNTSAAAINTFRVLSLASTHLTQPLKDLKTFKRIKNLIQTIQTKGCDSRVKHIYDIVYGSYKTLKTEFQRILLRLNKFERTSNLIQANLLLHFKTFWYTRKH